MDFSELFAPDKLQEQAFLTLLEKLVTIETPPRDVSAHQNIFALLKKELDKLGYESEIYPGQTCGGQLWARPPGSSSAGYQLMLGHVDTVWPQSTLQRMPFNKEGNVVTGPGIYDMKAGIVMMLMALKMIQSAGLNPALQPVIFLNSDEETGSGESREKILRLARAVKRVYVLEPSLDLDGKLKTRRKGVGHFNITVKGISSHAGIEPEKGRSAILELSHLIQKLFDLNDPEQGVSVNVGTIDGGISTNVIAPESHASVDVRVLTKRDADRLEKQIKLLKATTKDVTLNIAGGFNRPPLVQNKRNRTLWEAARTIGLMLGIELKQGISGGGSDGSFTSLHSATLDGLGAVGDGAHSPNEHILLEETLQRIGLLAHMLMIPDTTGKEVDDILSFSEPGTEKPADFFKGPGIKEPGNSEDREYFGNTRIR